MFSAEVFKALHHATAVMGTKRRNRDLNAMKKERGTCVPPVPCLAGVNACLLYDGKIPWQKFCMCRDRLVKHGGVVSTAFSHETTHIVTSTFTTVLNQQCICWMCPHRLDLKIIVVGWDWVFACALTKSLVPTYYFALGDPPEDNPGENPFAFMEFKKERMEFRADGKWRYRGHDQNPWLNVVVNQAAVAEVKQEKLDNVNPDLYPIVVGSDGPSVVATVKPPCEICAIDAEDAPLVWGRHIMMRRKKRAELLAKCPHSQV